MFTLEQMESFMQLAIAEAEIAAAQDEVPVGAVVVNSEGNVVAKAHNLRESQRDPIAHAELLAIQRASQKLGAWRLTGHHVFVTLEPCLMCAGAMVLGRIDSCIFGAFDAKAGALNSLYRIQDDQRLNHNFRVVGGVLEPKCRELLVDFFKQKR